MGITLLLSILMLATIAMGLAMRRRAPAVGMAFVLASLSGVWFAWFPAHLTALANRVGVGRGADLALYLGLSLCVLALAAMALQVRYLQLKFTRLARELALMRAREEHR